MNYDEWISDKKLKWSLASNIKLSISRLDITLDKEKMVAKLLFYQRYRASNYSDGGEKTLWLLMVDSRWKIIGERMYE